MEEFTDTNHRNLLFKEFQIEKEYNISTHAFHLKCLKILIITLFLQTTGIYFSNPLELEIFSAPPLITFISAQILNLSLYLIVSKMFPAMSTLSIEGLVFFYIIGAGEFTHYIKEQISIKPWVYFILGINIQTGSLFLLLSRIRWTHSLLIICLTHIHSWLRIIDVADYQVALKSAIISISVHILMLFTVTYHFEKDDRINYKNFKTRDKQLKALEELINQILPLSIIIIRDEKVLFFNNKTQSMFSASTPGEIKQILENVKIIRKHKFVAHSSKSFSYNVYSNGQNDEQLFSVFDLVKDWEINADQEGTEIIEGYARIEGELKNPNNEDNSRSFSIHVGPTMWKGKTSIVVISNEITYIRNHYRMLDEYKNQLIATVSHELRTPLNGVIGMQELMMGEIEEESFKEKLKISIHSSKLLLNMINDLLDFNMISKGLLRLQYKATNVTSLIGEAINILSIQAEAKGLMLKTEIELNSKEITYTVDPSRLLQVLLNLVGNAIKFTKEGEITIRVREEKTIECSDELFDFHNLKKRRKFLKRQFENEKKLIDKIQNAKRRLLFEIEDTGIGMKATEIKNLFKFCSRPIDERSDAHGIGLGLVISQNLVIMMNGFKKGAEITVSSEYEKGSKFSFPINVDDDESELDLVENSTSINKFPCFFDKREKKSFGSGIKSSFTEYMDIDSLLDNIKYKKLHVLAVDDDQINILVVTKYLKSSESTEFVLFTAFNGQEAIDITSQNARLGLFFDIFLMDCNMPVMNGYEASQKLKSMMDKKMIPSAPIVAITANVTDSDKEKCFLNGMDYFLTKPYMKDQLLDIIDEAMRKK